MIVYRELSSLERDLGISAKTLYAVSNDRTAHYRAVRIPKKDGGVRCLYVPDALLKRIQRAVADTLLSHMPVSRYAAAYRYGGSTVRNAKPHVGKPMVLKLDLYRFFDSIRYSTVKEKAFPAEIYAEPLRILLTMLCYYRDVLPQGAPSSPAITNIILREFDDVVGDWCRARNISYSRYCDDMTFSGDFDAGEVIRFVRARLRPMGLLLNGTKTRIMRQGNRQTVTGIVVNDKLGVPSAYRRRLRQELYYCRKFGIGEHLRAQGLALPEAQYARQLLGRVSYVLQADPGDREMREYQNWLKKRIKSL